jgi:beta-glucosidase
MPERRFPDGFLWGVATSAHQIEGAVGADGRGPSIWDAFSHEPGRIAGGDTGDVACDGYARWREDLDLLPAVGATASRFSIAWPRLQPTGSGRPLAAGLAHYDRVIDGLLERGVEPIVTLYHWDLPLALQERGGWRARATVERFAEYAAICADAYGDRVRWWVTINEPWIVGVLGHQLGLHAPGETDLRGAVTAMHHLLLAHGRATQELAERARPDARAGVAFSLFPHEPAGPGPDDDAAAWASDGYVNRWFLDPVLTGLYPADMRARYEERIGPLDMLRPGDGAVIATAAAEGVGFIGVNFYTRRVVAAAPGAEPFPWVVRPAAPGVPQTDAGWEVVPDALTDLLVRLRDDYGDVPVLITENGGVFADEPDADGRVRDERRIAFLDDHLAAVHAAIARGVDVRGYCHWSLMDNFEWAMGYAPRFGLVHVDRTTLRRTIKDSGRHYARIAATNALPRAAEVRT